MKYPPIWSGLNPDADLLNAMTPEWAIKPGATSRASTTTLTDDPDLAIALPRAGTWIFEVWLNYTGGTLGSSDLKVRPAFTGTSTFDVFGINAINTTATSQVTQAGGTMAGPGVAAGTNGGNFLNMDLKGTVVTTTTGTLSLQWAQNTSSGTSTTLRQGCWLRAYQLA